MSNELLVSKEVQLEKFPGKRGWPYARLPEVPKEKSNPFGWRKVRGFIDEVEIYNLTFFSTLPIQTIPFTQC